MLESITIITSGKEIILNDKMKISKFDNNKRKIVFEKKISEKINETKTIPINFETNEFNSRWGNFLIELENLNLIQNEIDTIILNFRNKFSFNEEDIIYKKENCFYVK